MTSILRLKRGEERRIKSGHPWIFSNEIDNKATPLKSFTPGQPVTVQAADGSSLGAAYVNPHSLICARVYSTNPQQALDTTFFTQRITQALNTRERLFNKPFYRLIYSEADQLPGLVADRFGDIIVLQINTAGMEQQKETIVQAMREVLPNTSSILFRNDSGIREQEGLTSYIEPAFGTPPKPFYWKKTACDFTHLCCKDKKPRGFMITA